MAQNDFSERLRRIEGKGGNQPPPDVEPPIRSAGKTTRKKKRSSSGSRRTSAIMALLLGASVGGVAWIMMLEQGGSFESWREIYAFEIPFLDGGFDTIPSIDELLLESAMNTQENRNEESLAAAAEARARTLIAPPRALAPAAAEPVTTQRMGPVFGAGFAAAQDGIAVPVENILAGFQPSGPDTPVGELAILEHNENCTLRPIGATEKLMNVNIGYPSHLASVQVLDDGLIIASLEDAIKDRISDGYTPGMLSVARGNYFVVDVIVTDTNGPLYLALQSLGANIVWNILATEGVEIAHIAMITNGASALTGNIEDATFEAIRATDFGHQRNFYDVSDAPEDLECMARPFRKPDESWAAWAGAKGGNTIDGNLLFGQDNGFDAYDYWFTQTLGVSSTQNLLSVQQAGAIVLGDVPAAPMAGPTGPHTLYIENHDHMLIGTAADRETQTIALYTDVVQAAAGGDYRETIPDAVEIGTVTAPETQIEGARRDFGDMILDKNDVESMVSLTDLNKDRRASFHARFGWDDLLAQNEAMPPQELHSLYGILRAPRLMQSYCTDTLIEIASKCGIYRATVHNAGDGAFQVRADFAYIPNYAIGDVTRVSNGEFISANLTDQLEDRSYNSPQDRLAFIQDIENVCDKLRAEYGNCLIDRVTFPEDRPNRPASARASASVAVYAIDNRFEEGNLLEKAESLLMAVQNE